MSDHDETREDGLIVCQRMDHLVATVKEVWSLVQAAEYVIQRFPRPPVPE